jgi:ribosomal protein S18 acetylase RimI-like enzyme
MKNWGLRRAGTKHFILSLRGNGGFKMSRIELAPITEEHHTSIFNVMKSLDKWFDEDALRNILIDLKYHKGYVAKTDGEIIGFITYFVYEGIGNIGWIGVRSEFHNNKIGNNLLEQAEKDLKKDGVRTMQVYTLSDTVAYEPYNSTRAFYYHNGFKEYRRVRTGNPSCPEELYLRKSLRY